MKPDEAVAALQSLLEDTKGLGDEAHFVEWRSKVLSVLRMAFGVNSEQVREFASQTVVKPEGYTLAKGPTRDREAWQGDAARRGQAVMKSAIYALEIMRNESPLDEASVDPELWMHVQSLIANCDWDKVPASVATFVEDRVRKWAGDPRQSNGSVMVGHALYSHALQGALRLGQQRSEHEGWLCLGMGLAKAIGNVDRHRIQQREDLRRYAMGVLGLGSLLLTQLRYEHSTPIQKAVATADEEDVSGTVSGGPRDAAG